MSSDDLEADIATAWRAARLVKKVTIGTGYFDPAYPFHGAIRLCPYCEDPYRVHGGHADHRDRCDQNPINQDQPERVTDGGREWPYDTDPPGVPAEEGESFGDLAERLRARRRTCRRAEPRSRRSCDTMATSHNTLIDEHSDLVAAALREAKHRPGYEGDEALLEELAQEVEAGG